MTRRSPAFAAACGAITGLAAWTTMGALAVDVTSGSVQFVGLLPSFVWLVALSMAGAAASLWASSHGITPALFLLPALAALPWTTLVPVASMVMWSGVAATIPFVLLAIGLTRRVSWPRISIRYSPLLAAAATALALGTIALTATGLMVSGDEPHYLLATESLWKDGDLDLANDYTTRTYSTYYAGTLEPRHISLGVRGEEFSFHGPGVSVLVLPGYVLGGASGARLLVALIVSIGAGFFWAAAHRLTASASAAWIAWAAMIASPTFAFHGVTVYPDGVAGAIVSIAAWALVRATLGGPLRVSTSVLTGGALALLPWLHIRLSVAAGVFGLALAAALYKRQRDLVVPFLAAPIISFVFWIASTWVMFGTTDPTAVFRQQAAGSLAALPTGVFGLLFDGEYGLLPYAPALALAIFGVATVWRRAPVAAIASTVVTATTVGIAGSWVWWGGESPPARFLAPVLPLIGLWLAAWWTRASAVARACAGAAITVAATLTALMTLAERGRYIVGAPDGRGTIFEWLSPNVDLALALPSLFRAGTTPVSEAALTTFWVVVGIAAWTLARIWQRRRDGNKAWFVASVATLAWLTLGASVGWAWRQETPWTPGRSQLQVVHAATSSWLDVGLRGPSPTLVSRNEALGALAIAMPIAGTPVALHVPFVPAGRYGVDVLDESRPSDTTLSLEFGRDAPLFATWPAAAPESAPTFTVAVPLYSVRVTAANPPSLLPVVRLRPLSVLTPQPSTEVALRVSRYAGLAAYGFDAYSYPERDGIWLAGDRTARLLVTDLDGRETPYVLAMRAGDADVSMAIVGNGVERTVTLAAGADARIDIAPAVQAAVTPLAITVSGAASQRAANGRALGVFVRVERP